MDYSEYINHYLRETEDIAKNIDRGAVETAIKILHALRERGGRLFFLGVGGSAANASHAVNDFRKLCHIEAYSPIDNVAELTAWTNDEGWDSVFHSWLEESRLTDKDAVFILSVGGGSEHASRNLVLAMEYAKKVGAKIIGIVSRDGGMTKKMADACILVPVVHQDRVTPHAEGWQGVIWHLIVTVLKEREFKWEGLSKSV